MFRGISRSQNYLAEIQIGLMGVDRLRVVRARLQLQSYDESHDLALSRFRKDKTTRKNNKGGEIMVGRSFFGFPSTKGYRLMHVEQGGYQHQDERKEEYYLEFVAERSTRERGTIYGVHIHGSI